MVGGSGHPVQTTEARDDGGRVVKEGPNWSFNGTLSSWKRVSKMIPVDYEDVQLGEAYRCSAGLGVCIGKRDGAFLMEWLNRDGCQWVSGRVFRVLDQPVEWKEPTKLETQYSPAKDHVMRVRSVQFSEFCDAYAW